MPNYPTGLAVGDLVDSGLREVDIVIDASIGAYITKLVSSPATQQDAQDLAIAYRIADTDPQEEGVEWLYAASITDFPAGQRNDLLRNDTDAAITLGGVAIAPGEVRRLTQDESTDPVDWEVWGSSVTQEGEAVGAVRMLLFEQSFGGFSVNNTTINLGYDLSNASLVEVHFAESSASRSWTLDINLKDGRLVGLNSPYDTWHANATIEDISTGQIRLVDVVQNMFLDRIQVWGEQTISEVVDPELVDVADGSKLLWSGGANVVLADGLTWLDLKNDYESLRITIRYGGSNIYTAVIETAEIVDSFVVRNGTADTSRFSLSAGALTSGTATIGIVGGTLTSATLVASKTPKTVVIDNSVPVTTLARLFVPQGQDYTTIAGNNAYQKIEFNPATGEIYDTDGGWSSAQNQYVVPKDGDYWFDYNGTWINNSSTSDDRLNLEVRVNGVTKLKVGHDASDLVGTGSNLTQGISGLLPQLSAGDIISLEIFDSDDVIIIEGDKSHLSIVQLSTHNIVNPVDQNLYEVDMSNGGLTDTRGSFPPFHPVKNTPFEKVLVTVGDRRNVFGNSRFTTLEITAAEILAIAEVSNSWREIQRPITYPDGAVYLYRLFFRHRDENSHWGLSFQDTHSSQTNTFGEIRRVVAQYQ